MRAPRRASLRRGPLRTVALTTTGVVAGFASLGLAAVPAAADGVPDTANAATYGALNQCYQTYTVPAGVTKVQVDAIGEQGQDGGSTTQNVVENGTIAPGGTGGLGTHVTATVTVVPGSTLYLNVGEWGMPGGYGGEAGNLTETQYLNPTNGGNGGGAAWVTATDPTASFPNGEPYGLTGTNAPFRGCEPTNPLVVAAGGGGGGGAGSASLSFENGGGGGSELGQGAQPGGSNASHDGAGGAPGAPSTDTLAQALLLGTGGSGGYGKIEAGFPSFVALCGNGYAGWQGLPDYGGQGGFASQDPQYDSGCGATGVGGYTDGESSGGGGGGGGGYYAGGGGGGADDDRAAGGGGGAGTSFVAGSGARTITQAAADVPASITITPLTSNPAITSSASSSCTVYTDCSILVTATGYPLANFGLATGSNTLPDGLTLYQNANGTALIDGTPQPDDLGTHTFTLEAYNEFGDSVEQTYTLSIGTGALTSVSLTPNPLGTFILGETPNPDVEAIAHYASGYTDDVSDQAAWSSSNPSVATFNGISTNGGSGDSQAAFDAVAGGTTTLSATFQGLTGSEVMPVTLGDPVQLTVTPRSPTVGIGLTQQFTATVLYPGGSTQDVTSQVVWSVGTGLPGDPEATISPSGLLTAVPTAGNELYEGYVTATYTNPDATTISGTSSDVDASLAHPSAITITPAQPSVASGLGEDLTATGTFPGGGSEDVSNVVTWHSSNNALAVVSSSGSLQTVSNSGGGEVTISASSSDGSVVGSVVITVLPGAPNSITVTPTTTLANGDLGLGQSVQFDAVAHYDNNVTQDVTNQVVWSSDDLSVATVSPTGVVTGTGTMLGASTAIRATLDSYGGGASFVSIDLDHPTAITITPTSATLAPGASLTYSAVGTFPGGTSVDISHDVEWSVANTALASFSSATSPSLQASMLGGATTTVTATSMDGATSASTPLTITAGNPSSITLSFGETSIGLGTTTHATATAHYNNGSTADVTNAVTWSSTAPSAATVDQTGLITATGTTQGAQAFITATYSWGSGSTAASSAVTSNLNSPTSIVVTPGGLSLEPGTTQAFTAMGTYPGGTTVNITSNVSWTSSDPTNFSNGGSSNTFEAGNVAEVADAIATSSDHAVSGAASVSLDGVVSVTDPANDATPVFSSYTSEPFTATGGSGSYVWSVSGAPPGIGLSSTTGSSVTLTGTPTTTNVSGFHITVTATDANDKYNSYFDPYSFLLSVPLASQTITLNTTVPTSAVTGTTLPLSITKGPSTGTLLLNGSSVCGFNPGSTTLIFENHGTCTVTMTQNGDSTYATSNTITFSIPVLTQQTLQWANNAPTNVTPGTSSIFDNYVLSVTSGNAAQYSIDPASTPGACVQQGGNPNLIQVTFTHIGTCILDANEPAITGYLAAAVIQQVITISPLSATLGFTSAAPTSAVVGAGTYTPTGTSTNSARQATGNPVAFSVDSATTNSACSIATGVVHYDHVGTCVLDMNEAATGDYAAATQVQQSFPIGLGTQKVTFSSPAPTTAEPGDTYTPVATSTTSTPITFSVDPSTTDGSCFFSGSELTFVATYTQVNGAWIQSTGHCTIDASQPATPDYAASSVVQQVAIPVHPLSLAVSISDAPASASSTTMFTVSLTNGGAPSTADHPVEVSVFATPSDGDGSTTVGAVSATDGGTPVDTLTIPAGQSSVTGYFGGSELGAMELVAYDEGGFLGSTTSSFTIVPGPVASLAFVQGPNDAPVASTVSPPVSVMALDAFGNAVPNATVTLSLTGSSSPTATEQATTQTDGTGTATFDAFSIEVPGTYTLTATAEDAVASAPSTAFTIWPQPVVDVVTPGTGVDAGGQQVTIEGSGFTGATDVSFGGVEASDVTVVSDTEITATTPSGTGSVDVVVSNVLLASATTANDQYTYVNPAPSSIALAKPAGAALQGALVPLTATVTSEGGDSPTGTVTFYRGATELGTAALTPSGVTKATATLETSTLAPGANIITASYGGDDTNAGATTTTSVTQDITFVPTVVVASSKPVSSVGSSVTFKASVTRDGGPGVATGSVRFKDGSTVLGTVALSGGKASLATAALAHGAHQITATYLGDTNDARASSASIAQSVLGTTKVTVSTSKDPSKAGTSVTLMATVAGTPQSYGVPSGSVTLMDGSTVLGTVVLSGGKASLATAALAPGSHQISALYTGDAQYASSTSTPLTQKVLGIPTITLTSSANPSVRASSVTFTATVARSTPLSGVPTGTVTFLSGTSTLGTVSLNAKGIARFPTAALGRGVRSITAVYSGDGQDAAATSAVLAQQIT